MAWRAELKLDYTHESQRTVARYLHQGPLRILQSLYQKAIKFATTCWCIHRVVWWGATP